MKIKLFKNIQIAWGGYLRIYKGEITFKAYTLKPRVAVLGEKKPRPIEENLAQLKLDLDIDKKV